MNTGRLHFRLSLRIEDLQRYFAAVGVLIGAIVTCAQTPIFKANARLVEIYATVFDHHGRAVDGLTKEQFEIRDNGEAQRVEIFETSAAALSCALLLDTTGSMQEAMPAVRNAARELINSLRPMDSAAVYSFTQELTELQEMTNDKAAARRALSRLRAAGATALFDSVSQLALQLEKRPGKKVIIVLTDGGDNASVLNRESAAQRARKAGVPVFAVAEGDALKAEGLGKLLSGLAESTGGRMYKAKHAADLDTIFQEISRDLENSYLLAFHPTKADTAQPWHELQILVKDTDKPVRVRARTGYSVE